MALDNRFDMVLSDYKRIVRELNKMEGDYVKDLRRKFREIAEPVRHGIRNSIPAQPPLSGMRRRLSPVSKTWNTKRRARTVTIRLRNPKRKQEQAALVQLIVPSAATIIADMAGRGNVRRQGKTEWYVYPNARRITDNSRPGERRHTVTTQGDIMIRALGGKASRFVYPGAEKAMPDAQVKFAAVVAETTELIERTING